LSFSDYALLSYGGLIAQRPHSAGALRNILQHYFGVPAEIHQFCGKWFALDESGKTRLGEDGLQNQLGAGAIAGDAVWNQQARVRIQLGPMPLAKFQQFLPNGRAFRALLDWLRFFIGTAMEFEVQPVLMAAEVPACLLSDEGSNAPRLGWISWLKTEEFAEDAKDAVFMGCLEVARA
jgi:type VI secretion system protein ImpH